MARINIDTGVLGNASTGDTLRTAMTKINTNFVEVYSLIADGSSGLIATDVTNGDLKLQANGTGVIEIDQLQVNGDAITSIVTNGSVDITGNGTGGVNIEALSFNGTSISSTDSSRINLNENVTVDGDLVVTGSITGTFTVSSVDADSTTVSNLEVDNFKASAIVTEAEGIGSNDNDTTIPTSAAVKDYVDARDIGDLSVVGSTISAPSNADLTLTTSGTGSVSIDGIQVSGTEISSTDSTQVTIKENLHVTGSITGDGSGLTGVVASGISSPASIDNITLDDNIISTSSNANLNLNPGGTGTVELQANTNIDGDATATTFIGDLRGPTVFQAKATEDITKGEAVYISGLSGNTPEVALARANSASTMPAFGIAESDIANTATGNIVTFGSSSGHDVSDFGETSITFALGDTVYISSAEAGKLTNVAPTGESNLIQNIGKIERVTPTTNMTIKVGGAGRTNATPALDDGNIFIGNGSNQSSTVSLATQIKSYTGLTVVGDDSSGTGFNIGETIKVAGASGITTAVSGDTLTITGSGSASTGDLTITGSTISAPSNADLTLNAGGTGSVDIEGIQIKGTEISSTDSTQVTIKENLHVTGNITGTINANQLSGVLPAISGELLTGVSKHAFKTVLIGGGNSLVADDAADTLTIHPGNNVTITDDQALDSFTINVNGMGDLTFVGSTIISPSNADITLSPGGTGAVAMPGVTITDNTITSNRSNDNLELNANGTGTVVLENLKVGTSGSTVTTILDEDNMATNSATALATQQSIKAYVDSEISGVSGGSTGDLTITGSTISAPSNADLTLTTSGSGTVTASGGFTVTGGDTNTADLVVGGNLSVNFISSDDSTAVTVGDSLNVSGTFSANTIDTNVISSNDSSAIQINDSVNVSGGMTVAGGDLNTADISSSGNIDAVGFEASGSSTFDGVQITDNKVTSAASNANLELDASGTGGIIAQAPFTFNAGYIEKINTLTSSSTITVNCALASIHTVTLATATEFNITNLPTGGSVTLIITQDGTGSRTATFGTDGSSAVKFPSNSSTLSTGAGDIDVVTIVNDGTNFLGNIAKDYRSS